MSSTVYSLRSRKLPAQSRPGQPSGALELGGHFTALCLCLSAGGWRQANGGHQMATREQNKQTKLVKTGQFLLLSSIDFDPPESPGELIIIIVLQASGWASNEGRRGRLEPTRDEKKTTKKRRPRRRNGDKINKIKATLLEQQHRPRRRSRCGFAKTDDVHRVNLLIVYIAARRQQSLHLKFLWLVLSN